MKIKQIIALVVVVALLMAGSVLVTFAYLTDTQSVRNTFTVGQVKITLDETAVDANGEPIPDEDRRAENEYHLMPGHTYTKDPKVTVAAGSDESHIRMIVTIEDYADLCAAYGKQEGELSLLDLIPGGQLNEGWSLVEQTNNVFECRYADTVTAESDIPALFEKIYLASTVSQNNLEKLGEMEIVVVAHAIQADGFNGNAELAWAAFDAELGGETDQTPVGGQ